jgi:hypothetical protein
MMNHEDEKLLADPDLYAAALHHWLLTEGARSAHVRHLTHLARRVPGAELERIFETKLAEFNRYRRDTRTPTLWNLPVRAYEWLAEHAKFTPVRELYVLGCVVVVLVGMEVVKRYWSGAEELTNGHGHWNGSSLESALPGVTLADGGLGPADPVSEVDRWLASGLKAAANSPAFQQLLGQKLQASIDGHTLEKPLQDQLRRLVGAEEFRAIVRNGVAESIDVAAITAKVRQAVDSAAPADELQAKVKSAVGSPQTADSLRATIAQAVKPDELQALIRAGVQNYFQSEEFRAAVRQALAAASAAPDKKKEPGPAAPPKEPAAKGAAPPKEPAAKGAAPAKEPAAKGAAP